MSFLDQTSNNDFLLEAKWHKDPVDIGSLDSFSGKLSKRLENTLGLFSSVNGYSPDTIKAHLTGRRLMILMDGSDLMTTKNLSEISDEEHKKIMMCLNTTFMTQDTTFQKRFVSGRYKRLEEVAEEKTYTSRIIEIYPEWIPNRGMGFYFQKLEMELYGTPRLYAWFQVEKQ